MHLYFKHVVYYIDIYTLNYISIYQLYFMHCTKYNLASKTIEIWDMFYIIEYRLVPYTLISVRLQGMVIYFTTWGLFVIYFTSHIYRYIPKPNLHVWTFFKIDPQTKGYQGFVVLATLRRAVREGEQARGRSRERY